MGEDLCLMALEKPDKAQELCLMLDDYIERQRVFQQGRLIIDHLSSRVSPQICTHCPLLQR